MPRNRKQILVGILSFPVFTLIGYLALCAVYCIPAERIGMHVRESAAMFDGDNLYKELSNGDVTTRQDYFTDALMLINAAYNGPETPFSKAINIFRLTKKDADLVASCSVCNELPAEQQKKAEYSRYWHGYLIPVKIIFFFLNINEFRSLNLFIVLGFLIIISLLLYKRSKARYILPLLLAYSFINPLAVSASLQYSAVYYIASFSVIILLLLWNNSNFQNWMWYYFMLIGMSTSYMDLLTYPIVTLGFPLILYFAFSNLPTFRLAFRKLVGYSASWGLGYAGFWGCKWLLSSIVMRNNYFSSAVGHVKSRSGNIVYEESVSLFSVFEKHLKVIASSGLKYILLLGIIFSVVLLLYAGTYKKRIISCIMILLITSYPFLWYTGTINHSYIHFFTYRDLSVSIFAITSFLLPLLNTKKLRDLCNRRHTQ